MSNNCKVEGCVGKIEWKDALNIPVTPSVESDNKNVRQISYCLTCGQGHWFDNGELAFTEDGSSYFNLRAEGIVIMNKAGNITHRLTKGEFIPV